jgi:hypothetical protein
MVLVAALVTNLCQLSIAYRFSGLSLSVSDLLLGFVGFWDFRILGVFFFFFSFFFFFFSLLCLCLHYYVGRPAERNKEDSLPSSTSSPFYRVKGFEGLIYLSRAAAGVLGSGKR